MPTDFFLESFLIDTGVLPIYLVGSVLVLGYLGYKKTKAYRFDLHLLSNLLFTILYVVYVSQTYEFMTEMECPNYALVLGPLAALTGLSFWLWGMLKKNTVVSRYVLLGKRLALVQIVGALVVMLYQVFIPWHLYCTAENLHGLIVFIDRVDISNVVLR